VAGNTQNSTVPDRAWIGSRPGASHRPSCSPLGLARRRALRSPPPPDREWLWLAVNGPPVRRQRRIDLTHAIRTASGRPQPRLQARRTRPAGEKPMYSYEGDAPLRGSDDAYGRPRSSHADVPNYAAEPHHPGA
jgi:hypothetical protein